MVEPLKLIRKVTEQWVLGECLVYDVQIALQHLTLPTKIIDCSDRMDQTRFKQTVGLHSQLNCSAICVERIE